MLVFSITANAQYELNLDQVLQLAVDQSIDLKIARSQTQEQEWNFQKAKLQFTPQLFFDATLPNINRRIEARKLPDGQDAFVNTSTMYNSVGLSLDYFIERTGGRISLSSNLQRLDVFKTANSLGSQNYFVNPISIQYSQPLFAFNALKWEKKRLSLLYDEFKERYAVQREEIILKAINLYKNCHLMQQKISLLNNTIAKADSVFQIKEELFNIGKGSKVEMLRLILTNNTNKVNLASQQLAWKKAQMELADFIGVEKETTLILADPELVNDLNITKEEVLRLAKATPYIKSNHKRRLETVETDLAKAKKNRDITFNLGASLGLNGSAQDFNNVWNPLLDKEIFRASIRMPLSGYKRYELAQKIAQQKIWQEKLLQEKEIQIIKREALDLISRFQLVKQTLKTRKEALSTANKILKLTTQQFLQGSATLTDLNLAQQGRDGVKIDYYQGILDVIEQYYQIRKLCMYDFIQNKPLQK